VSSYQRQALETLVVNNGRSSKYATGSDVWNLNLDQIESGTGRILAKQIVPVDGLGSSTFSFEAGTVLYSKLRPYLNKVIVADEDGVATTELVPLRCNPEKLLPEYLAYYLRSPEFLGFANVVVAGAKMPRMVMGEFWKHQIPLPPLPEQRRIAAILDQADTLRAKRREALAELDQLTQSIFIEMFGDPRANDRFWPVDRIGSLVSGVRGGAALEPDDFIDQGFPVLHKGAIKPQGQIYLDPNKKTFVDLSYANSKPNSIVDRDYIAVTLRDLVPSGPSVGLSADLRRGPHDAYILAQGAYAFRLDQTRLTPEYFVELSNAPTFRLVLKQNAVGSTQIHIRTPIYLDIKIPVPPLSLQTSFSKKIRSIEVQKATIGSSIVELDSLFSSLQHRAFRGEL
jgi:type I restriction enzyme S subunit